MAIFSEGGSYQTLLAHPDSKSRAEPGERADVHSAGGVSLSWLQKLFLGSAAYSLSDRTFVQT